MTDLKPCPFCGGAAKYELAYGIRCLSCASHVPCGGDDYGPWNRRADLPPKVRALEWEEARDGIWTTGLVMGGEYRIRLFGGIGFQISRGMLAVPDNQTWFPTIEAAKAAAQADYEARILAALVQP